MIESDMKIVISQRERASQDLRLVITRILHHNGFQSATTVALDSFATHVEAHLEHLIRSVTAAAQAARRETAIPTDFERVLQEHSITSLFPPKRLRAATSMPPWKLSPKDTSQLFLPIPILHEELRGTKDREGKKYIPAHFPPFPSVHSFQYTLHSKTNNRDTTNAREEAALSAKHSEEALRRLVRASKIRKQKEVRAIVQSNPLRRQRSQLWETAIEYLIKREENPLTGPMTLREKNVDNATTIVNWSTRYHRKEVPRKSITS